LGNEKPVPRPSTVAKYMVKRRGPPSQVWRTFLHNHAPNVAAIDMFGMPTVGIKLLYAIVIMRLDRRVDQRHHKSDWGMDRARQITEAFPWDEAVWSKKEPADAASRRLSMIEAQKPAQSLVASHGSLALPIRHPWKQQDVALPLVIPLGMEMVDKVAQRPPSALWGLRSLFDRPFGCI
jgi:hypothetical protein